MMKYKKNYLSLFMALILFAGSVSAKELTGSEARQKINDAQQVNLNSKSEIPEFVKLRPGIVIPIEKFDLWAHQNFNLPKDYGFKLLNIETDKVGMKHYRYQQTFKGYLITGTMFIVHTKDDAIATMNGTLFNKLAIESAALNEQTALNNALNYTKAELYRWQIPGMQKQLQIQTKDAAATWFPKGELMLAPVNGNISDGNYRLSYRFDIYAEKPLKREYVFVDAGNGKVIYTQARIHHTDVLATATTAYSGNREITTDSVNAANYRLRETGRGQGIETYNCQTTTNYTNTDFTDADNIWNNVNVQQDEYATDAHWGAEKTYDFYYSKYGRNSIDNNGFKLISYVHYDVNFTNAFWDGTQMTYGDGGGAYTPLTSLDITGHEISHGLTELTSNLIYADESGALNESFSDCMGNAIRYYGKQPGTIDWLIGNEIGGTPFRSMSDPNQYNNPDCYNGQYWNAPNEVHNNSGVMNYWFYLLTEGGSGTNDVGDAFTVTGLGIDAASAICYRMNTVYLVPSSDYAEARTYAIQAAIDLYGPCTNEVIQTTNAWYAVGVGSVFNPVVISDFVTPVTSYCSLPASVSFTNFSNNGGFFTWDFGDGTTDSAVNPTHIYNTWGLFTITLIADGGTCGSDTMIKPFYISVDSLNPCNIILPATGLGPTQTSCAGNLYDSGGPTANYTDNTDATITIAPAGAASITLTFTSFNFENNYDYVYVYDGPTTASPLIGQYTGNALPNGGSITSSGGSITLRQTSDQGVTASGFVMSWLCFVSSQPPVADFAANVTTTCTGVVQFDDNSTNGPVTWEWDFGDGNTSTLQFPTNVYAASGLYTVQLIAGNANGSDTTIFIDYITVNLPVAPTGTGGTFCENTSGQLTASGTGVLNWFDVPIGGTSLGTGSPFNTPLLTGTTTFYVESDIYSASQFVGPVDNNFGTGSFYNNATYRNIIFDCVAPARLVSVQVFANGAGNRTITLIQNGITINSLTVNIPDGASIVNLNFDLPVANDLELGMQGNNNLYRNQSGATFPYTLNGLITLTGTNAGNAGYYYFFYNWEVQEAPCASVRVPVVANTIAAPVANFSYTSAALNFTFTDLSTGATSWDWNFGDPGSGANNTSTLQNPTHTFTALGIYNVTLITSNGNCSDTTFITLVITNTGVTVLEGDLNVSVYPNPAKDILLLNFNSNFINQSVKIKIADALGKIVLEKEVKNVSGEHKLNISGLPSAAYSLTIESGSHSIIKRIVKQ